MQHLLLAVLKCVEKSVVGDKWNQQLGQNIVQSGKKFRKKDNEIFFSFLCK